MIVSPVTAAALMVSVPPFWSLSTVRFDELFCEPECEAFSGADWAGVAVFDARATYSSV